MPKKVPAGSIQCPGCECEITPDGKTLVKRSAKLVELQKLEKAVPALESELTRLEKEIEETKKKNVAVHVEQETEVTPAKPSPWFRRGSR